MIADRIRTLDTRLFAYVESQTSDDDRKSLLAVHHGIATRTGGFSYLEIGSHLGGSLQVLIADPRCVRCVSIDSRPQWMPTDRAGLDRNEYPGNSTEQMRRRLETVPDADLSKLETVDESTENLAPGRFARPDFCFIDAEHTYRAALRDARFCRTVMQGAGIIAFHNFFFIERAILHFLRETPRPHRSYLLRHSVFVIELGAIPTLLDDQNIRAQLKRQQVWTWSNRLGINTLLLDADVRRRQRANVEGVA
jgi:hypothetical protein